MNEALTGAVEVYDVWSGVAALLVLWLLYRLSDRHPLQIARRARRALVSSVGLAVPLDLVMENLRQLLDEDTWGDREMSSWRKKSVDAWLDELVDHAIAAGLQVSEEMARFAEARRDFHQALRECEDRPLVMHAARRLSLAGESLFAGMAAASSDRPGLSALAVLA